MSVNARSAFSALQPFCVDFIQKQDVTSLRRLHDKLKETDKDGLDEISQYVLFPFRMMFKTWSKYDGDFVVKSIESLSFIFSSITIADWPIVKEFLTQLSCAISNPKDKELGAMGSEELKGAVSSAIMNLLDHTCLHVREKLYHFSSIPLLGHVVSLLLSIASDKITMAVRISALEALKALAEPSYCAVLDESSLNETLALIGDCMSCFLPGVSTALAKIVVGDTSAGHKVKTLCMDVTAVFILKTLADNAPSSSGKQDENDINPRLRSLLVKRDANWINSVSDKLGQIFDNVCSVSNSDNWRIRLSCVKFCGTILIKCKVNLKKHASTLLKVPVKLLNDEYDEIKKCCSKVLDNYSSLLQGDDAESNTLVEMLEENLFALCTSLPRVMRTSQDVEKLSTLKIFLGYLSLLKEKVVNLLYSSPHLKKLTIALLHCFELDLSSIQLMEVAPSGIEKPETDLEVVESCFRKEFKHFRDVEIYKIICRICNSLGQYGDLHLLMDNLIDIYTSSEMYCKQAVLILNQVLLGTNCSPNKEPIVSCIKTLMEEFLSPENWYLVTRFDSEYCTTHHLVRSQKMANLDNNNSVVSVSSAASYNDTSLKLLKSNTLLCCLHLEAIVTFSRVLKTEFCPYLMHTLYPVLEKTTDPDSTISGCAIRALYGLALNCGYKSSSELVAENADYLISDISIQIRRLDMFPRCPAVLQAMLDHSNADILTLISDTVDEILSALDLYHLEPRKLFIFTPVLFAVVKAIRRWAIEQKSENNPEDVNKEMETFSCKRLSSSCSEASGEQANEGFDNGCARRFVQSLKAELLSLHKEKKIASLDEEPVIDPNWNPGQEEDEQYQNLVEDDEKKDPPMKVKVAVKILCRCNHLMAHGDPRIRMRIMDVIVHGMAALTSCNNELLPMVHKLWSPLIARFGDSELQVVMKAFDTLCVISQHSKDFLRKRFCKEVLPKILSVLRSHAKRSVKQELKSGNILDHDVFLPKPSHEKSQKTVAYNHSVIFKLQQRILTGLGPLLKDLDVRRSEHLSVCQACTPYLSSKQPRQLQEAASVLFKYLIKINSDLTWLHLTGVWCEKSVLAPLESLTNQPFGDGLQCCYLGGDTDPNSEFSHNVKKLIHECH